jgi:hypothetical protein
MDLTNFIDIDCSDDCYYVVSKFTPNVEEANYDIPLDGDTNLNLDVEKIKDLLSKGLFDLSSLV